MIREWCRTYAQRIDLDRDYLPWVVETFSGVLGVDEVYQVQLALLLAVDPAVPEGDLLVGYPLVEGTVDQATMTAFLSHLKDAGIDPDQVITDGAAVYPPVLAHVWPNAAHQLCLFHETRRVTAAVLGVVKAVRKEIPTPPSPARLQLGGRKRKVEPAPRPPTGRPGGGGGGRRNEKSPAPGSTPRGRAGSRSAGSQERSD